MTKDTLINNLINQGYLKTPRIINAFKAIDRRDFVRDSDKDQAYADFPLAIGYSQTISQPLTVAFMLEKLQPEPGDKILDIGSGSGWSTALLSFCAGVPLKKGLEADGEKREVENNGNPGTVVAVELKKKLCQFGCQNTSRYFEVKNLCNKESVSHQFPTSESSVLFVCKDGSKGMPALAPFDRILVSASASKVPPAWKKQLKIGGTLVFPMLGCLWRYVKKSENQFKKEKFSGFSFVRLIHE